MACMAVSVRRAGYYEYHNADAVQARAGKQAKRDELVLSLKQIRAKEKKYGVSRLRLKLIADSKAKGGTDYPSYGKIYKLCSQNGLLQKTRTPKGITKQDPKTQASEDLVKRDFTADTPNKKWLGDISEVACKDGNLYIAPIMDCFDGAIVGLSMADNKKAELCKEALDSAVMRYGKSDGLLFHSDRASQYTSNLYRSRLDGLNIKQSMGKTGSCYDNAKMESFFATLKKELIYDLDYKNMTRAELSARIFASIELEYNRDRLYSPNEEHMPPLIKRALFYDTYTCIDWAA